MMPDVTATIEIPIPADRADDPRYVATAIVDTVAPALDEMREAGVEFEITGAEVSLRLVQ